MNFKSDFIYTPKGVNRQLHVYLPDNYDNCNDHYPVLYFFDGHNLFFNEDATYGKSWGMKEFLESWDKEIIVIGIECGHNGEERLSEYLPYPADKASRFSEFEPCGDVTMKWIINELKPYVDSHLRTLPERTHTAIGGSSMGGLMALYAAVHYNDTFSKAACVSSAIGFCMEEILKDMAEQKMDKDTRIYLSWGTKESKKTNVDRGDRSSQTYKNNKAIADMVRKTKAKVHMECQVNGGHCEADWEKQVPIFMDFLWKE